MRPTQHTRLDSTPRTPRVRRALRTLSIGAVVVAAPLLGTTAPSVASTAPSPQAPTGRAACAPPTGGPLSAAQVDSERRALGSSRRVACLARWEPGTPLSAQEQRRVLAAARSLAPSAAGEGATKTKTKSPKPSTSAPAGAGGLTLPKKGLRPADIASVYALDATKGADATVGIVVAYDNPSVEADLAVYRATFGLPACTSANGCFRKVDQRGSSTPPEVGLGWALEIALDTQAVSAACPRCKILLVEADSDDIDDVGAATQTAVALGADVVSHSYGTAEFDGVLAYGQKFYGSPGVPDVVSSGDHGYGAASFPAVLPDAIAVGGTRVVRKGDGTWTHSAWTGAGSGCSKYVPAPSWQVVKPCAMRATSDLSAVADTRTGLAVYHTYGMADQGGWLVVGGTSLAAPLVAAMIAMSGDAAAMADASPLYRARGGLLDVVKGSNGKCGSILCKSKAGWDGPTGLGTPQGLGAFAK